MKKKHFDNSTHINSSSNTEIPTKNQKIFKKEKEKEEEK